jgi:hypothetical protein
MAIQSLILLEAIPLWAYLLATIVTSSLIGSLITLWVNRGKPKADIHESRARAAKDFAEADEITLRASLTLGEQASHWTRKMMKAQSLILDLELENQALRRENHELRGRKQIGGQR